MGDSEPTGKETRWTTVGVPRQYLKDLVDVLQDGYRFDEVEVKSNVVQFRLWKEG